MAQTNESQEQVTVNVETLQPVTRTLMTIGALPTSYLISMTYEEQLLWLQNYLIKTVIPAINNNAEATQEVQDIVMALQDYINDYFNNLDVQEEINNKLDEMVEDGTLQEIVSSYLETRAIFAFDTVQAMKEATNLINGSYAHTLGYYDINDGGDGLYKIRNITNEDVIDNGSIIPLNDNNLIAELIIEDDTVNIKQFGAKGDNIQDDTTFIQNALNYNSKVYIPKGEYKISHITLNRLQYLYGEYRNSKLNSSENYSIIIPRSSDRCVLKDFLTTGGFSVGLIGTASEQDMNCVFDNLVCSGGYGFHISHRGHNVINCRAGNSEFGFYIDGTDNTISNCISAVTQKHGFAITGANNNVSNCKAFLAGSSNYGVGFIVTGAFCRVINCEAQQNNFENYFIQNSFASNICGCISDGAFTGKSDIPQYSNSIFGTINTSAILLHNLNSTIIEINNINGSTFGTLASTLNTVLIPYPNTMHKNTININNYIRDNHDNIFTNIDLYRLASNNDIRCDGINYNSLITKRIKDTFTHSFEENTVESNVRLATIPIPTESLAIAVYFPSVSDKTNIQSLYWDFMITYVEDGTTKYKGIPNQNVSSGNNSYYNIQSVLDTITYDSITSIDFRIIATNKANSPAFTFTIEDAIICPSYSNI